MSKAINEWIKQRAFTQIGDHYDNCLAAVKKVAESGNDEDLKLRDFRKDVAPALDDLKAATEAIAKAGYLEGFSLLADLQSELATIAILVENEPARDVVISEITRRFAINEAFNKECRAKGHATRLAVFRDMLVQAYQPGDLARKELQTMPEDIFFPALLVGLECLMPPFKEVNPNSMVALLGELKRYLNEKTEQRLPLAVEFMAAHINAFATALNAMITPAPGASAMGQRFLEDDIALRPEFLAPLYALTQAPVLVKVGEFALRIPSGELPYAYLESMGIIRSAEWHHDMQGQATNHKRIALYEYALMTPGYELNPATKSPLAEFEVKAFISLIKREVGEGADGVRKRQELFDLMANLCAKNDPGQKIRTLLVKSDLPKELFKGHLSLLGDTFGRDLGI